jgi:hypothetical protein
MEKNACKAKISMDLLRKESKVNKNDYLAIITDVSKTLGEKNCNLCRNLGTFMMRAQKYKERNIVRLNKTLIIFHKVYTMN